MILTFKRFINEKLSTSEILVNPSISELKQLIKIANYNSIRFTINTNDDLKAGDAENFTHQDIEPAYRTIKIRGIIKYKDGKFIVKAYGAYDQKEKSHSKVDAMLKSGMINGFESLNENVQVTRRTQYDLTVIYPGSSIRYTYHFNSPDAVQDAVNRTKNINTFKRYIKNIPFEKEDANG